MPTKQILSQIILFFSCLPLLANNPIVGKITRLNDFPSNYVAARNIDIWVPEDYDTLKQYAVLYMHDGQMLFDSTSTWNKQEWKADETLSNLINEDIVQECIIVGVWNNQEYRRTEYFPEKALQFLPHETRDTLITNWLMGEPLADQYLAFLTSELKPYIDKHYSTLPGRQHTFIAGSSMGGLISMYAVCEYPDVFGGAACLSTHWPGIYADSKVIPLAINDYLFHNLPEPGSHKIYFDFGTETIDSLYEPYQQIIDKTMKARGYDETNWKTLKFEGADHSENAWAERFEIPLTFLLQK